MAIREKETNIGSMHFSMIFFLDISVYPSITCDLTLFRRITSINVVNVNNYECSDIMNMIFP